MTRLRQWTWRRVVVGVMLILSLGMGLMGCNGRSLSAPPGAERPPVVPRPRIMEVSPPEVIQDLRRDIDSYQPQVSILSPRNGEVFEDDQATVRVRVRDLPLFKDEELGLGPYLQVFLDDQPYQAVYDADAVLIFQGLAPGTHTIRAIAARPWHETFKNEGAFALTTFHSYTKTPKNNPDPNQPLITYSFPQGNFGAEPIMLDFYLTNVPLHFIAQERSDDAIKDWRIRCTVNGESFVFEDWQPIYLKGLRPGKNWVQLELLDEDGRPTDNVFNNTVRLINYEPGGTDTLAQLTRGELTAADLGGIVDPNYEPPPIFEAPSPIPPESEPIEEATEEEDIETASPDSAVEDTQEESETAPDEVSQPAESQEKPSAVEPTKADATTEEAELEQVPAGDELTDETEMPSEKRKEQRKIEGDRLTPSTLEPSADSSPAESDRDVPDELDVPSAGAESVERLDESVGAETDSEVQENRDSDVELSPPDLEEGDTTDDKQPNIPPAVIEEPEENPAIAPLEDSSEVEQPEPSIPNVPERRSPVEVPKLI
ncbi:hypothetical protein [Vacuolonema iberomarrocanum]|uniref:hypothetical protein n=1 Tax=Vacuolonema iberomarrocanum TaxID=3454632 RepID=UPI0019DC8014|nr:hypothetical protein [filamentous cyanobacterium LEGE 07170]